MALPISFITTYCFSLPEYLAVPFFYVAPPMLALRLLPLTFSFISLFLLYYIIRHFFDWRIALATSFLTTIDSCFSFDSLAGIWTTEPIINALFFSGVAFFIAYRNKGRPFLLYLSMFMCGLGFSVKLTMLWRVLAVAVAWGVYTGRILPPRMRLARSDCLRAIFLGAAFATGALLMIWFNFTNNFPTIREMARAASSNQYVWGNIIVNNFDFTTHLKLRLCQYGASIASLTGEGQNGVTLNFLGSLATAQIGWAGTARLVIFLVSLLGSICAATCDAVHYSRKFLSVCAFFAVILICSCFSLFSFRPFHLMAMFPFAPFAVAFFTSQTAPLCIIRPFGLGTTARLMTRHIGSALFAFFICASLYIVFAIHGESKGIDGRGQRSTAIFSMVDYLVAERVHSVLVLTTASEHLDNIIYVLSGGVIEPHGTWLDPENPEFQNKCIEEAIAKARNGERLYAIFSYFNHRQIFPEAVFLTGFSKMVLHQGLQPVLLRIFYTRNRKPVYALYEIQRQKDGHMVETPRRTSLRSLTP
jgi:hypothetical protein